MFNRRLICISALLLSASLLRAADTATPVQVRHTEGLTRGFVVLRTTEGETVAVGDLSQVNQGSTVHTHLVLRFKDGSLHDEDVTYSQSHVFRLLRYKLVQKGPSFPKPMDVSIDASSHQVTVRYTEDGKEKVFSNKVDLPVTVANGMLPILAKNLPSGQDTKVSMVAFTPKPQVVTLAFATQGEDTFTVGGSSRKATRYNMKIEIGGVKGAVAPLVGKQPPDSQFWVLGGDAPAFLMSQGPLYYGGPIWRIELTSPVFPNETKSQ
jgi:hypothetical protein